MIDYFPKICNYVAGFKANPFTFFFVAKVGKIFERDLFTNLQVGPEEPKEWRYQLRMGQYREDVSTLVDGMMGSSGCSPGMVGPNWRPFEAQGYLCFIIPIEETN